MASHPAASRRRFIGLLALGALILSGGSALAGEAPFPTGKWLAEDIRGGAMGKGNDLRLSQM